MLHVQACYTLFYVTKKKKKRQRWNAYGKKYRDIVTCTSLLYANLWKQNKNKQKTKQKEEEKMEYVGEGVS